MLNASLDLLPHDKDIPVSTSLSGRRARTVAVTLGTALATVAALLMPLSAAEPAAADEETIAAPDGLTQETAAASCWEIKQLDPASADGVYWIATPELGAAQQFYCDQTTDGGGWVLIGRGREDWSESNMGYGTTAQVSETVTGTAAFSPRQLSSDTIDALLNGESVSSLSDGIRLRRALDQNGTQWQNLTFTLKSPRDTWTWQFYNEQRVNTWTVDGTTRSSSSTTTDFGSDNTYLRVSTTTTATQGWKYGFGYGSAARGNPSDSSYIWAKDTSTGNPRPFTQVYLRPKLMSSDVYTDIADEGTAAITNDPVVQSTAMTTVWGVSGLGNGPRSVEGSNEVSAFAEIDGVVYVGGNFTTVQKNSSGGSAQSQAYLAAFDVDTGEWISTFRPTFDYQVKALAALPGGRLAVGGYFTTVNGETRKGLAVLDAATGELDESFSGTLINYLSGGVPIVRGLDVQDGWLYVAGTFTHSTGGTQTREVYTRAGARFSVTDGTPDSTWNPEFNGTAIATDASDRGDRVYFAGYFSLSKTATATRGAAIATADASVIPWAVQLSSTERAGYQQAVKEVGDKVWLGGSEHSLFSYDRDTLTIESTVVGSRGGDFQAIATDGTTVYGGCHCFDAMYSGASTWPSIGTSWTSADRIYGTGAWSARDATFDADFSPILSTREGAGSWALFVDSTGTLWAGGDYTYSVRSGFVKQWSGGFVRFAATDTTAPDTPSGFTGTSSASSVSLSWNAVDGASSYEVLRNDRVVASATGTSVELSAAPADTRYFVRAVDAAGNRSASTSVLTITPPVTGPQDAALIAAGSDWSYLYTAQGAPTGWQATAFDDSSWSTGAAPIGWGQASLGTTLTTTESSKPLASFYRKSIEVTDASTVESVLLTTRADDGIIVYVNGTEVLRQNMADGASGVGAYATVAVSAANALSNALTVTVPGYLFTTGENVITAEVHSNYRTTPSHSFELTATATFGTQPEAPSEGTDPEPAAATVLAAGSSWSYSYASTAVEAGWNTADFDASGWTTGQAPLGWGQSSLGTTVTTTDSPAPLTSYYRTTVDLTGVDADSLTFTTRADDGIVIYVNGAEVQRSNMPAGTVSSGTYASSAVSATNALANPVVFTVPASAFTDGVNVISAEVHSNYRTTPSHSFDLEITNP